MNWSKILPQRKGEKGEKGEKRTRGEEKAITTFELRSSRKKEKGGKRGGKI